MQYVDIFLCTRYNTSTLSYKWFGRWHITVRITWFLDVLHHASLTVALSVGPTQCLRTISSEEGDTASLRKHLFISEYNAVGEIQKTNRPNFQAPSVCRNVTEHVLAID